MLFGSSSYSFIIRPLYSHETRSYRLVENFVTDAFKCSLVLASYSYDTGAFLTNTSPVWERIIISKLFEAS